MIDTLDNSTAIRLALRARGEPFAAADSKSVLLNRLMKSVVVECYVVGEPRKIAQSSALEDLQTAVAERALTPTGNRKELLDRLYDFSSRCEIMQRVIGDDFTCTRGVIPDMLSTRHLSTEGPKEELLAPFPHPPRPLDSRPARGLVRFQNICGSELDLGKEWRSP